MESEIVISYFEAILRAQREEMKRDPRVIMIGEDIAQFAAIGALGRVDERRVWSAPISELGFTGMAIGAAITGLRPIVDLTVANFLYLAMDQIVNQAAKLRYMTGGQLGVPIVFRAALWHNGANAAQHSDRPYSMFMNVPGLKIVVPATPTDMKGLLKAAVRDDDPVLVFEDKSLWGVAEPVPTDHDFLVPIGKAALWREGDDVTIASIGSCLAAALDAAGQLEPLGIAAEVIDLRSLVPLDRDAILSSVAKTGRLVVVDAGPRTAGAAAEIAALAVEEAFDRLKAPVRRVVAPDVNIPFNPAQERPLFPSAERIVAAVRQLYGHAGIAR